MKTSIRTRLTDTVVGAVLGLAVGAIIAVNVVITAGVDLGYQASFSEIFEESVFPGVVAVAILAAGPVIGVVVADGSASEQIRSLPFRGRTEAEPPGM